jgi:sirohydrochlorin cobaltochelatase
MAHGGGETWNRNVADAVAPLRLERPTALAYGMADRHTLGASLDSLSARGATHVAVVRAFLSGDSFLDQTAFYLGLSDTPPVEFLLHHGGHGGHGGHGEDARLPIQHGMTVATHPDGILPSLEATEIMVDRARELSETSSRESVILIAHGMGDDDENDAVLDAMEPIVDRLREHGFASVRAATLREDWPEARAHAEADIRAFVQAEADAGRRILVLPMRLEGFGPYADVLEGFSYVPGGSLLPHPHITNWLRHRVEEIVCEEGWGDAAEDCVTGD